MDVSVDEMTPLVASAGGCIKGVVSNNQPYVVSMSHPNDEYTMYGHLKTIADGITTGMCIEKGHIIGYSGGDPSYDPASTKPHVEFAIMKGPWGATECLDPEKNCIFHIPYYR
jgi:murein DD-endopeptidase MepM/ murein hydrolase activator NlpD